MRVYAGGKEIPPSPGWRIWALPNPWGAGLAFDGIAVTRWRSWERIRSGMFLLAEFGGAVEADEVRLLMSEDQRGVRMRLEGQPAGGGWRELSGEPHWQGFPVPLTLRRMAMQEVRRGGVTHLLVRESDHQWEDLSRNRRAWGIRELGAVDGYHLFQLE